MTTEERIATRRRVYDMARRRARVLELPPGPWLAGLPDEVRALGQRELEAIVALAWGGWR